MVERRTRSGASVGAGPGSGHGAGAGHAAGEAAGKVYELDQRRIERALRARSRYRYVQPRVLRDGAGWRVVSPNCSRNVAADGGEIDIARLEPGRGAWVLLARDHERLEWRVHSRGELPWLLRMLAADPSREFWL